MTADAPQPPDRADELRIDHALFGLSDAERAELQRLDPSVTEAELNSLDLAAGAGAAALIAAEGAQELPESAARRLRLAASAWEASRGSNPNSITRNAVPAPARSSTFAGLGWLAAAACLALAAFAWFFSPAASTPTPAQRLIALADQRDALVREAGDLVQIPWTATEDPAAAAGVTGEVLWSDARNEGYMVIKGLAANDPTREQYQLWVFDAQRDDRHPVDGGVFDIPAGADEVIIPIDVRVPVSSATLFAVTVEKPGGVVVSSRDRLPILAKVEKG